MSRGLESFSRWIDASEVWRLADAAAAPETAAFDLRQATDAELVSALEAERMRVEGVILIDLRERALFAQGHILDALSLPLEELLSTWRPGKPAIVYDADGALARLHIRELRDSIGPIELFVLDRGLEGWVAEGLPLER